jgi:hypothetical protein
MKIFSFLIVSILLLSACEKEDFASKSRRETAEKIIGKWMMQRTIYEVTINQVTANPLPLLDSKIEVLGTANDYFDFQANESVQIKTSYSDKFKYYRVSNPSLVMVGEKSWGIEKLTGTELVLKLDRDAVQCKRSTRMHLSRCQ